MLAFKPVTSGSRTCPSVPSCFKPIRDAPMPCTCCIRRFAHNPWSPSIQWLFFGIGVALVTLIA